MKKLVYIITAIIILTLATSFLAVKSYASSYSTYSVDAGKSFTVKVKVDESSLIISSTNKNIVTVKSVTYSDGVLKLSMLTKKEGTATIKIKSKADGSLLKAITFTVGNTGSDEDVYVSPVSEVNEVFELVNKERIANGLEPFVLDEALCKNASVRVKEVATYYSHIRPDGTDWYTALTISYTSASENIARGYTSASQVTKGWLQSADHRKNILSNTYTKIGIGYDKSTNSRVQLYVE